MDIIEFSPSSYSDRFEGKYLIRYSGQEILVTVTATALGRYIILCPQGTSETWEQYGTEEEFRVEEAIEKLLRRYY